MVAQPSSLFGPAPPSALATIIHDLQAVGAKPTPLAIIATATDRGMSDAEIEAMLDKIAAALPVD